MFENRVRYYPYSKEGGKMNMNIAPQVVAEEVTLDKNLHELTTVVREVVRQSGSYNDLRFAVLSWATKTNSCPFRVVVEEDSVLVRYHTYPQSGGMLQREISITV